jgi:hypothetical protein
MDTPLEGDLPEALFLVLTSLARTLVDNGAIKPGQLETIAIAFRMQSEATSLPEKKANTGLAADLAAIMAVVGQNEPEEPIKHSHLRVVRDDEDS